MRELKENKKSLKGRIRKKWRPNGSDKNKKKLRE